MYTMVMPFYASYSNQFSSQEIIVKLNNKYIKRGPWSVLGAFINYVDKILRIFDPPSMTSLIRKLMKYGWHSTNPLSPLLVDIIFYGYPLVQRLSVLSPNAKKLYFQI